MKRFFNYIKNLKKQIAGLTASHALAVAASALVTAQLIQCETPEIVKFGNEPSDGIYTIYQGRHSSVPMVQWVYTKPARETGAFCYDSAAIYNTHNEHQMSWSKVVGPKQLHSTPMPQKAGMAVERYDSLNNVFQFAPYFNLPGDSIVFPNRDEIFHVALGDSVRYLWEYTGLDVTIELYYRGQTISKTVPMQLKSYSKVHPWHGGRDTAPTTRKMYLKAD